jgi:hypothetical protein
MARVSKKINFSVVFFNELLKSEGMSVPEFAPKIDLTKQTLYENLRDNSISKEQVLKIARHFKLNSKDFDLLIGKKPLPVFFRREKREEVEEVKKDKVRELAELFLKFNQLDHPEKHLPIFNDLTPGDLALEIRSKLELNNPRIPFEELVSTLKKFGVYVFFYPFDTLEVNDSSEKKKIRAASIPFNKNWIIFLDTSNELVDSIFDLFHELAHIFAGHELDSSHSDELEVYCNNVAIEVMTPSSYFKFKEQELKIKFSKIRPGIVGDAEKIQFELGCSFKGLILALDHNGILNTVTKRYLHGVSYNKKRVASLLNKYFIIPDALSPSAFWYQNLNDSTLSQLHEFYIKIKIAYLEGRITTRLVAQGFGIDISSADTLCKKWIEDNEVDDEAAETSRNC